MLIQPFFDHLQQKSHLRRFEIVCEMGEIVCEMGENVCEMGENVCEMGVIVYEMGVIVCEIGVIVCEIPTSTNWNLSILFLPDIYQKEIQDVI